MHRYAALLHSKQKYATLSAGMQAGIAQGRSEGVADGLRQAAKILKQLGDPVQKIMQATGLTQEEVEALN